MTLVRLDIWSGWAVKVRFFSTRVFETARVSYESAIISWASLEVAWNIEDTN